MSSRLRSWTFDSHGRTGIFKWAWRQSLDNASRLDSVVSLQLPKLLRDCAASGSQSRSDLTFRAKALCVFWDFWLLYAMLGLLVLQLVIFAGSTSVGAFACLLRLSRWIDQPSATLPGLPGLSPLLVRAVWTLIRKPKSVKTLKKLPQSTITAGPVCMRGRTSTGLLALCPEAKAPTAELPLLVCPSIEAFRLCLALLVRRDFPLSVLGSVLVKYKATQFRQLSQTETLTYR